MLDGKQVHFLVATIVFWTGAYIANSVNTSISDLGKSEKIITEPEKNNPVSDSFPNLNEEIRKQRRTKIDLEEKAKINMVSNYDEFTEIIWHYDKYTYKESNNRVYLYIGQMNNDYYWMRFRISRMGFFDKSKIEKFIILTDNDIYTITPSENEVNTSETILGFKNQWYDTNVNDEKLDIVRAIINSSNPKIRVWSANMNFDDRKISSEEKVSLQIVLDAYKHFTGGVQ